MYAPEERPETEVAERSAPSAGSWVADAGGARTAATTTAAAKTIVSTSSARRFIMKLSSRTAWRASELSAAAARSEARNFFEVILPHEPKTACIARTWV